MIGKTFEFNGQIISNTTADYRVWLDVVQWKSLDVSDEQNNVQWFHGIKLSPTFARGRRITLEGVIIADTHTGSSKGIDYLESLFALQGIPSTVELLPFIVTDEQDRQWELNCKIKEPLQIDTQDNDWMEWSTRRWRVVLQSEDPRYYWVGEQSVVGAEWNFGGVKLWVKLWVKLNEYFNEIQINAEWNTETQLIITLTALGDINTPLMIKNITAGTFFALDVDAVAGDVIVINSKTFEATKNGANIKASRIEGSTWPKSKWVTSLSIYDDDGWLFASDFDISITWRDALL